MKRFKKFIPFILMLLAAIVLFAGTTNRVTMYNGWTFEHMYGDIVPNDTVQYSTVFSLPRDRNIKTDTYPMCAWVDLDSATYGTNGDVSYFITIQGSYSTSAGFSVVDTLYNSDDADSTVAADDTWTLNPNLYPKYLYYRIKVAATNVAVATPDTNSYIIKLW